MIQQDDQGYDTKHFWSLEHIDNPYTRKFLVAKVYTTQTLQQGDKQSFCEFAFTNQRSTVCIWTEGAFLVIFFTQVAKCVIECRWGIVRKTNLEMHNKW